MRSRKPAASERSLEAKGWNHRQPLELLALREVIVVEGAFDRPAVRGVEDVEIEVERPGIEGPDLVGSDVELLEVRQPRAVRLPVDGEVDVLLREVARSDDRGIGIAADVAEASSDLPSVPERVGGDDRQVVRLIEIEEPLRLAGPVDPVAAR